MKELFEQVTIWVRYSTDNFNPFLVEINEADSYLKGGTEDLSSLKWFPNNRKVFL